MGGKKGVLKSRDAQEWEKTFPQMQSQGTC